ncbi:hypothetical protein H9L25_00595 [Terrisporobacter mayombei]|nr:hypothetical protein [Terrisporobacter mayombei]
MKWLIKIIMMFIIAVIIKPFNIDTLSFILGICAMSIFQIIDFIYD